MSSLRRSESFQSYQALAKRGRVDTGLNIATWILTLFFICSSPVLGQTGTAVPSLAAFDQLMNSILTKYSVPGGSIALTQNGPPGLCPRLWVCR